MSAYIVITTINSPTEAIKKFAAMQNYKLIVVGDKKTPVGWQCDNAFYLPADAGLDSFALGAIMPYNHYCRKMLGYLYAIKNGAQVIIDTDDDNIPKLDWAFPPLEGIFDTIATEGFVNIYKVFTTRHIWPRGLPLSLINNHEEVVITGTDQHKIGVWQGLADEDPDVDAIYRLTNNSPCYFNERAPVVLSNRSTVPFNSQNTLIRKEVFALLYLPTYVTFRFTDILRGLVAQPIMWLYGYQLGFIGATVVQKRNPHDFYKDFLLEIPMYEHVESVIGIVTKAISASDNISNNLYNAYVALKAHNIVEGRELQTLQTWLNDLKVLDGR